MAATLLPLGAGPAVLASVQQPRAIFRLLSTSKKPSTESSPNSPEPTIPDFSALGQKIKEQHVASSTSADESNSSSAGPILPQNIVSDPTSNSTQPSPKKPG
eukprot:jgi/Hompol1/2644/HPOL_000483-RA